MKVNSRRLARFVSAAALVVAAAASKAANPNPVMNNTEKVIALLKSIETGQAGPVAYINPHRYVQHNLAVADGLAGFGALLQALPKGSARVNTVRAFQDDDFV